MNFKIIFPILFFLAGFPVLSAQIPFGGITAGSIYCDCNQVWLITQRPVAGPAQLIYSPRVSKLYDYGQITKPNTWILGLAGGMMTCNVSWALCMPIASGPLIIMVGTSGTGSAAGGDDNGDTGETDDGGGTEPPTTSPDQCLRMGDKAYTYQSRGTGYYPDNSPLEGGFEDMHGISLKTLQQFLAGRSSYVSVAMDKGVFPYGTELCIPELEQKYGKQIIFKVVDTGGAFMGKGTSRIDICTENKTASMDATINGSLQLVSKKAAR